MKLILAVVILALALAAILLIRQSRLRIRRRESLRVSRESRDKLWEESQARQRRD